MSVRLTLRLVALSALWLAGCGTAPQAPALAARASASTLHARANAAGPMMYIGGGPDQSDLMTLFMTLAGGPDRPLLVVPLASDDPAKSGQAYVTFLQALGARHASTLIPSGEPTAADLAAIAGAGGCFFSGGSQARILGALTPAWRTALQAASRAGAVMAGTSAGAMIWGDLAIMGGDPMQTAWHGDDPNFRGLRTQSGLAIAAGWVVDTHFSQRGRVPRLAYAVARTAGETGLGVDPETAAVVRPDGSIEVAGRGTVTVLAVPPQSNGPAAGPLSLRDLHLDVLRAGDRLPARPTPAQPTSLPD